MNQTHYSSWPKRLPYSLIYPETPLFDFLETSARRFPNRSAVISYGRHISYSELQSAALRLAAALSSRGVRKGDRVGIYMQNCPHFIISYFGIMRANAVVVPLNPMLVAEEFQTLLKDSGTRIVITTSEQYPRIAEICRELQIEDVIVGSHRDYLPETPELPVPEFMYQAPESIPGTLNWNEVLEAAGEPPAVEVGSDDLCLLPYTAGSTGIPKGCMHTHATVTTNAFSAAFWNGHSPSSMSLSALPFFHVTGMVHGLLAPIVAGGGQVILTRWDRNAAFKAFDRYKITHWINITTMLIDLLAAPDIRERDISSLQVVGGGGAPLPPAVGEALKELTGLDYMEGYGLTETISQTHMNPPDGAKLGSIGIPDFDVDARIVNLTTLEEVPMGEEGEIVIDGPEVFKGYWNQPKETEEAFMMLDGKQFFRTGDIGRMDDEGYFYVIDRVKRMINAAGFKVWPTEVEKTLYHHPAVQEACVIGVADPQRVETVKAYVVPRSEYAGKVTAEEIIQWSKERMSAYKYPRIVEFVDALPKSGAGKVLWRQLQEEEKAKQQK